MADRKVTFTLDLTFGEGAKNLIPDLKRQVDELKRSTQGGGGSAIPPPPPPRPPGSNPGYQTPGQPGGGSALNTPVPTWARPPIPGPPPAPTQYNGGIWNGGLSPAPGSAIFGGAAPAAPAAPFQFGNVNSGARAGMQPGGGVGGWLKDQIGGLPKFLAPLLAAHTVVSAASSIGKSVNDPYQTEGQAQRSFFRNVVPFGGTLQDTVDNISGRTAGYERAGLQSEFRRSRTEAESYGTQFGINTNPAIAGLKERAAQMGGASPILMGRIDRSTAAGDLDFREKSRLLPIQREIAKAEREAAVSTKERKATEQELYKVTAQGNQLVKQRADLQDQLKRGDDAGVKRQETLLKLMDNEAAVSANIANREAAVGKTFEARQRDAQAQAAPALMRAKLSEAKAESLEARADTASGAAFQLGAGGPFERARGLQAFKMLQETGNPDMLPPMMRQAALQFGGASAQKIVEKFGAGTAEFKEGMRLAPEVYGDPEKLRREASSSRDQAERDRLQAESTMAASASKAGESLGATIANTMQQLIRSAETRIMTQLKLQKNAN